MAGRHVQLNHHTSLRVQTVQRACERLRRFGDDASRARRGARCRRARLREVVVDLPPHAIDLLLDRLRQLAVTGGAGALRFLRQHRERCLETVREIAGLRDRAPHGVIAVLEKRVQIGDERLDFGRIAPGDLMLPSVANGSQLRAHVVERGESLPHLPKA